MTFEEALPLILPIEVLQLILALVALWDLSRPERMHRLGERLDQLLSHRS